MRVLKFGDSRASIFNCYSPFDQTLHRLRLPSALPPHDFVNSAHGWLLLLLHDAVHSTPVLLNPVTGARILLPLLDAGPDSSPYGAISAPPSDPHFSVLIKLEHNFFLYRHVADRSSKWIKLDSPLVSFFSSSYYNFVFHCADKFYCVSETVELYVVDPFLPMPSIQLLEMDTSQLLPYDAIAVLCFQECNGEILVLALLFSPPYGFH